MLTALVCLTTFQTNRSIYIRSLGLFLIFAASLVFQFQLSKALNLNLMIALSVLLVLGFASDYYSASLRTWFFRVSTKAVWGFVIGGFIGLLLASAGTLIPFILFSLLGALIGEIRARGMPSFQHAIKVMLGSFAGVFGMSAKLLIGMEMVFWFLRYSQVA